MSRLTQIFNDWIREQPEVVMPNLNSRLRLITKEQINKFKKQLAEITKNE